MWVDLTLIGILLPSDPSLDSSLQNFRSTCQLPIVMLEMMGLREKMLLKNLQRHGI